MKILKLYRVFVCLEKRRKKKYLALKQLIRFI